MTTSVAARQDALGFLHRHVLNDYLRKWVFLGALIGIGAGVGAIIFTILINGSTWLFLQQLAGAKPPLPAGEGDAVVTPMARRWLLPLIVALGGLISGVFVYFLAPEAAGDGPAIGAFHEQGGRIRARVPIVKVLGAALLIGSGSSTGPEGPSAQMVAGFGSWVSDVFHLTPQDRRTALAVGLGAGIGAIFKAPLGGAILGAELIYVRDFELEALVPGFIASVVGYTIFGAYAGWDPIFGSGTGLRFSQPEQLIWFGALGIACGVIGILNVRVFFGVHDLFNGFRVPRHVRPAIGGVVVGCIAYFFPQIMSTGYGWLQLAINGNTQELAVSTIVVLVFIKIFTTALTVGSGGAGGVFAPGLFIGGMVGAAMWGLLHNVLPGLPATPAPFVIVGMAAMFGGIAKAPIAVILMVAEMTNEFSMVIPAMLAVTLAYLVAGNVRIYESQLETRSDSPAHRSEYIIPFIQTVSVADAMTTTVQALSPGDSIADAEERITQTGIRGFPVVRNYELVGIFSATDALRAKQADFKTVGEAMTTTLLLAFPGDSAHVALRRMTEGGVSRLPVVARDNEKSVIGMISVRDIARALDSQIASLSVNPDGEHHEEISHFDPFSSLPVREAMTRDFDSFLEETPTSQVLDRLVATRSHSAVVVNDRGTLVGLATLGDLRRLTPEQLEQPIRQTATMKDLLVARPAQAVAEALAQPGAETVRQLPVVQGVGANRIPVGMLRRIDVVSAYLRARDRQASISRRLMSLNGGSSKDDLTTIDVSVHDKDALNGRSLSELGLPNDAIITSIVRGGRPMIPRGRVRLQHGDVIHITAKVSAREAVLEALGENVVAAHN